MAFYDEFTWNKSAEISEKRNNYASVIVPPEQIRRAEQIRCDTSIVVLVVSVLKSHGCPLIGAPEMRTR